MRRPSSGSMTIEFVEAKISGSIALFEKLAEFLDKQVSKAVLGQTAPRTWASTWARPTPTSGYARISRRRTPGSWPSP
jgi:hypothetical protein